MSARVQALLEAHADHVRRTPAPERPELMLATLTDRRFSDPGWVYERKLDGERCVATVLDGAARLRSRTHHDLTRTYPEVAGALPGLAAADLVVDGELVAYDGDRTSFPRLQQRLGVADPAPDLIAAVPVVYSIFDLLWVDGCDVNALPLPERDELLVAALDLRDPLERPERRERDGEAFYDEACAAGWEGLIAKRADAPYVPGRSKDWLKFKCLLRQEFVIGGWTEPAGSREHLGALLVGYHEDAVLRYAGKVGTGFDGRALALLAERLFPLERPPSPFADAIPVPKGAHWAEPRLVAEIAFAEWTNAGRLRQPRYLGLRDDKDPSEVVRERPAA